MAPVSELPWQELHGNLRAFISRRVRNPADVDDLVQRVLLQIVKGLASLSEAERLHAWMYRTARNVIVDYYRSSAGRHEVASGGAEDLAAASAETQANSQNERAALQELAGCMAPMIRRLSPEYREAVVGGSGRRQSGRCSRASGRVCFRHEEPHPTRQTRAQGRARRLLSGPARSSRKHRRI
jgi:RNA polymerase sigma factor (sigma-70 family)